jgi:hypothetical protein
MYWRTTIPLLLGALACLAGGYVVQLIPLMAVGALLLAAAGLSGSRDLWPLRDCD